MIVLHSVPDELTDEAAAKNSGPMLGEASTSPRTSR